MMFVKNYLAMSIMGLAALAGTTALAGINVTSATYGKNCGVPEGNVTSEVAAACNNLMECRYKVDHNLIGDPAIGCKKNFHVKHLCGDGLTYSGFLHPEASGKTIVLRCSS